MQSIIIEKLKNRKIIILGFGREGYSSYRFIRRCLPEQELTIADESEVLNTDLLVGDTRVNVITGPRYCEHLNDYDLIFKTPGINLNHISYFVPHDKIVSQTDLFLAAFGRQVTGVTGTKGKSTTASLITHLLQKAGKLVILAGNIGVPFFDIIEQITPDTLVVAELSAHQLEYTKHSPHVSILLNLYQEHLDHFSSFSHYMEAKANIAVYQSPRDIFIYNLENTHIEKMIEAHHFRQRCYAFGGTLMPENGTWLVGDNVVFLENKEKIGEISIAGLDNLPGRHNMHNVMASMLACRTWDVSIPDIEKALPSFKGLEHRMEKVGIRDGILFYNDSISTIPEATIAAINTLKKVDTLILGGFDRGISYHALIDFLPDSGVRNIIFTGPAGKRILTEWEKLGNPLPQWFVVENNYEEIVKLALLHTLPGKICLLSPAASSYDQFKNFEERGCLFKGLIAKK
ncbi:MAG: UDP-N-acetylmuramoyl-L-alanine--D-glutamate ligase [Bacteroidales bacterium]|jgi:UDP-N-acetylmuramoylalanine--D-glutamate ligase|nr:UDP-N-acetylmuramoyl-L-alanine--D-glutamate ligase [Bacteroidales bacterium]